MSKKDGKLTKRQAEILQFIKDFHKRNGYFPTYAEIGAGLGINDSTAYITIKRIAQKGFIQQDRRPRMMKILD